MGSSQIPIVLTSPRSTVLTDTERMTSTVPPVNGSNMASDKAVDAAKVALKDTPDVLGNPTPASPAPKENAGVRKMPDQYGGQDPQLSPMPQQIINPQGHGYASNFTPLNSGYYAYPQATPEPPSPATHGAAGMYDVGSFMQQAYSSPFGGPNTPLSPPRATATVNMGGIPPASPLFPRVNNGLAQQSGVMDASNGQHQAGATPSSPSLPYMTAPFGTGMYQGYPVATIGSQSGSSEEGAWGGDRNPNHQNAYPSPQINPQTMQVPYRANSWGRAGSFEEPMLPPTAGDQNDDSNPAYPGYNGSQPSPLGQQPWPYPDMYNSPGSPLTQRNTVHAPMQMYPGQMQAGMRPMAPYGQFYQASSPGPPIQTTASNKGPDGANLFIFHIPNHFTNLDMYQLFCPYGNLLSVRIMVEKDTGRSRGFGFVSYDNPESAAVAIKELNGFAIGNKRLKVQHKQIRSRDGLERDDSGGFGESGLQRSQFPSLPPSGHQQGLWESGRGGASYEGEESSDLKQDEGTEHTSPSTAGAEASPLASLASLQNALSDVSGNGNPE